MEKEILAVPQSAVAQALAADYFCIYYVNVQDDTFIEYFASEEYRSFGLAKTGDDFIAFSRNNFEKLIYAEDRERFLDRFTRDNVLGSLDRGKPFTMTFRMMFHDEPTYVHLKVTRMIEEEVRHAVIGISSVDEQLKAREAFERAHSASMTYSRIARSLAKDYFSIYIVDTDTDNFTEYSSAEGYEELGVQKEGGDFFNVSRKNMERLMHPDDLGRFLRVFTKENVLAIVRRDGHFTTKYRLMLGGEPVYVSMKATLLEEGGTSQLIIGTNNIDAQMKRETEYQQLMADAKTSARNDFLANMSHDIRTPMNAIVGYTNIANANYDKPEIVKDSLAKIGSSSHFLLSLINDILDISKIESGKMQLNCGRCDLNDIFRRIEDITLLQARDKSLHITYDHSNVQHYIVNADELRIEQILINIVSNAIKYTPAGKRVDLKAEEEPGTNGRSLYRFIIADTGIGISEEYLPHLFESFTREEKTTVNAVQGTGLGLAITAKVVELMGGEIRVKSEAGKGSVFTVELELEELTEEAAETVAEEECISLEGRKILLVEDNVINAEIASLILTQHGIDTEIAGNGLEGVEMIRREPVYDAVLMDIQMPVMNGYEATREIRNSEGEYFRKVPVIAMSANAYAEDVQQCLEAGMNDHIAKPFDPDDLIKLLHKYICG